MHSPHRVLPPSWWWGLKLGRHERFRKSVSEEPTKSRPSWPTLCKLLLYTLPVITYWLTLDSRPHVERQEKEWRYPSHPRSSVHHGQSTGNQVEMVWACTTPRRKGLCQENLGGRRTWTMERRRQRKRWIDVMKYNMEDLRVDLMDVENRATWRRRTRVADPSPEGSKPAWRRETERDVLWLQRRLQLHNHLRNLRLLQLSGNMQWAQLHWLLLRVFTV